MPLPVLKRHASLGSGQRAARAATCLALLAVACRSDAVPIDATVDLAPEDAAADAPELRPPDTDGDGLSDEEEELAEGVDTDGDGTPDGLDLDSDDDGLPDQVEGQPRIRDAWLPPDSDGDGVADFRDTDSDGNGRPDGTDAFPGDDGAPGDLDADGLADFRDPDDDGDFIFDVRELGPSPEAPGDFDGDGAPDFRDVDSDDDTILDSAELRELQPDGDGDGFPDYLDLDSDGDGVLDAVEAGDADLDSPPVDSDTDGFPDYLDLDSDDEGLPDRFEHVAGLSRVDGDTDDDGTSDFFEAGVGTDGLDPEDDPARRGWLVVVANFRRPPVPESVPAALTYDVPAAGVTGPVAARLRDVFGGDVFLGPLRVDVTAPGCSRVAAEDGDGDGVAETFVDPPGGSRLCWTLDVAANRSYPNRSFAPLPGCAELTRPLEAALEAVNAGEVVATQAVFAIIVNDGGGREEDPRCTSCEPDPRCRAAWRCSCAL